MTSFLFGVAAGAAVAAVVTAAAYRTWCADLRRYRRAQRQGRMP